MRLLRRQWTEFTEVAVAATATGAVLLGIFLIFDSGVRTRAVQAYWSPFYLPRTPSSAIRFINTGIHRLLPYFGIPNTALLAILIMAGIVVLAWQGRWATAALLPVFTIELIVLSALHKYPLFDKRTSTFLITSTVVVAAIGVAGASTVLARRTHIAAGILIAALAAGLYIPSTIGSVDAHTIPAENVRAQAAYVTAQKGPDDVVLVSVGASYGFAYYTRPHPDLVKSSGIGLSVTYPTEDRIVALAGRDPGDIRTGLARAVGLLTGHPGARLWVIILPHLQQ